ncbi:MAG: lipid-A-disaccharide synthase [Candidatus Omnitrophica bacterium]|nr:lipid-A-disaccharide synthase [Candidatus Omnitrophota bacterium]HOX54235.1 lipid-A-disaccharide synthase [Candidatus Omnitrophota bacterium]
MNHKKIFIIAGEASGDMHGAHLAQEIRSMDGSIKMYGLGGEKMQAAGVEILYNLVDFAVVGFIEVLKHYGEFKKIFYNLLDRIEKERPEAVILIDYPGFNLRLAKKLKERNIKVIYYISPQIWAWGKGRIRLIKRCINKMIVILKFEEALYKKYGVDATFIGHPLLDVAKPSMSKKDFLRTCNLSENLKTVALLPGSREKEVERILPVSIKTAEIISQKLKDVQFIILRAPTVKQKIFDECLQKTNLHIKIIKDKTYDGINASDLVICASGTATLETAILNRPLIILYKLSFPTWLIIRCLLRIRNVGLVNIVARKLIMPEFIQFKARPARIARQAIDMLTNKERIARMNKDLLELRELLGSAGARRRAAKIVLDTVRS